jgi:hypothetical protein
MSAQTCNILLGLVLALRQCPKVTRVKFEWIPEAFRQLCGLEPAEVHEALSSRYRWPRSARDTVLGLQVLTIWARTGAGRPLVVAVRQRSGWEWECVGARIMSPPELADFESWERER